MKKNIISIFIIILMFYSCKSTIDKNPDSQNKIKDADSIFEAGNLDLSLRIYKSIKKNDSNFDRFLLYKIASIYSIKNEKIRAFKYINEGAKKDSTLWILEEPNFYNLISDKKWKKIEDAQLSKVELRKGKFKNKELVRLTYKMYLKDQSNFYEYEHFENKKKYSDLKNKINQENLDDLESIILQYGWPTISKVGSELSETAFLIIQHQNNLEKQKQYLELIEVALKNHDIHEWNYAYLKDRVLIRENKKQLYGTQLFYDEAKNKSYFDVSTLENIDSIDTLRKSMNMESISVYLERMKIKWHPKEEKLYPE